MVATCSSQAIHIIDNYKSQWQNNLEVYKVLESST
jgi:hypothetical protein